MCDSSRFYNKQNSCHWNGKHTEHPLQHSPIVLINNVAKSQNGGVLNKTDKVQKKKKRE